MTKRSILSACAVLFLLVIAVPSAHAQVSLAGGDRHEVAVDNVNYTVIKDADNPKQWYYIPAVIRLVEDKKGDPKLTLLKYQMVNPADATGMIDGGILQFSVTLAPPAKALDAMQAEIAKVSGLKRDEIKLAGIPMKNALVRLYNYDDEFVGKADTGDASGPSTPTAEMPFSIKLTKLGAQTFEKLLNSSTGYKIEMAFDYAAITPKAGVKVTFDWSRLQTHTSSELKEKSTTANYCGWWHPYWYWRYYGRSEQERNNEVKKVFDELKTDSSITVEKIIDKTNKDKTAEQQEAEMNALVEPVLARIKEKLVQLDAKEPEKVEPAKAADVNQPRGQHYWWGTTNTNSSYSSKEVNKSELVKETFSYQTQYIIDQSSKAGGFIGLGDYPEEVRKRHELSLGTAGFEQACFTLPPVSDCLDIVSVTCNVGVAEPVFQSKTTQPVLLNGKIKYTIRDKVLATWKPDTDWTDPKGNARAYLLFALDAICKDYRDRKMDPKDFLKFWCEIKINRKVGAAIKEFKTEKYVDLFTGDASVSTPLTAFNAIQIYCDYLTFSADVSTLRNVQVTLTAGGKSLETIDVNAGNAAQTPRVVLVDAELTPVKAVITYNYGDLVKKNVWLKKDRTIPDLLGEEGPGPFLYLEDAVTPDGQGLYFKTAE